MTAYEPLRGLVVCLPHLPVVDLIGPLEVMIQEGLNLVAVPSQVLPELVPLFGLRARIGACGIASAAELDQAVSAGASFVFADAADPELAEAGRNAGVPTYLQAMTPSEIRYARSLGYVQLFPADVLGHLMAERLKSQGLLDGVIPRGGIGAYAAERWLLSGAPAVCLDSSLLGDALRGGELASLRDRCGTFLRVLRKLEE